MLPFRKRRLRAVEEGRRDRDLLVQHAVAPAARQEERVGRLLHAFERGTVLARAHLRPPESAKQQQQNNNIGIPSTNRHPVRMTRGT